MELGPKEKRLPNQSVEGGPPVLPVFKLKEILVPVDFTECTEKALFYALPLAQQFNATVTLLHVVEPPYIPASEMGVVVEVETKEDARNELEALRKRVTDKVRCQTIVRKGSAEREIIEVANELDSDLIIVATHGRTGLDRLLMGSTAEKIVRRAGCPILVVRPHEHEFIAGSPQEWEEDNNNDNPERVVEEAMKASM